jgi:hypothetical protein
MNGEEEGRMSNNDGKYRTEDNTRRTIRCRSVDKLKINLIEVRWVGKDWIDMASDRDQWKPLLEMEMNLRVPQNIGNC